MAAATTYKSPQHILAQLVGLQASTDDVPVKAILKYTGATANPADFTAVANASALTTATIAASGVAVGDVILGYGVVSGLATNQVVVDAYVSATDVITVIIGNLLNTSVTTTAVTMNFIVADVT